MKNIAIILCLGLHWYCQNTCTVQEVQRLKFSQIASTLMACEKMDIEKAVGEMLERVDSYSLKGDNLFLSKGRMAPLVRFEAVYL